jgi:hypothetical protein
VHHHFVQRWNCALDHQLENGHWPSLERANNLAFPSTLSPPSAQGTAVVQVLRSVRPHSKGGYSDPTPTVVPDSYSGSTLDIRDGEQSIYEQYKLGIVIPFHSFDSSRIPRMTNVCVQRSLRRGGAFISRTSTWLIRFCLTC